MKISDLRYLVESKVREYLKEERGINKEVEEEAKKLAHAIEKRMNSQGTRRFMKNRFMCVDVNFSTISLGEDLNISAIIIFLHDDSDYDKFSWECYYDDTSGELNLMIPCMNGKLVYNMFIGSLQHELTHVLQTNKNKDHCAISGNSRNLYKKLMDIINKTKDDYVYQICFMLYTSFKVEQEAFGNNLYIDVKNRESGSWNDAYMASEYRKNMENVKEVKDYLVANPNSSAVQFIVQELKDVGINYNKLLKLCDNTYNNLHKRAMKVISLAQDRRNMN